MLGTVWIQGHFWQDQISRTIQHRPDVSVDILDGAKCLLVMRGFAAITDEPAI